MTESGSNSHNVWGVIPGKSEMVLMHDHHMFNILNSDDVIYKGAKPVATDMGGYMYQEFDDYQDRNYIKHDGTDKAWVELKAYQWLDRTDNCVWHNGTSD